MTSVLCNNITNMAAAAATGPAPTDPQPMSVFDMNTRAVVCLKEGHIHQGMESLRETLVQTRTLLLSHQQEEQTPPAPQQQQQQSAAMETDVPLLSLFTVPLYTHRQPLAPGDAESAHCPLFDRAFVLGGDNSNDDNSWKGDAHCQNVTLGVLLYNLALSHHLSAIHHGCTSPNDYQVAINLYQMALSLVETSIRRGEAQQDAASEECQNLVVLLCAIFNNMANIHSRHFHVTETRNCLECLKEIVANSSNVPSACLEEDHFFFYLNLFVTAPVHDFAIAPAA